MIVPDNIQACRLGSVQDEIHSLHRGYSLWMKSRNNPFSLHRPRLRSQGLAWTNAKGYQRAQWLQEVSHFFLCMWSLHSGNRTREYCLALASSKSYSQNLEFRRELISIWRFLNCGRKWSVLKDLDEVCDITRRLLIVNPIHGDRNMMNHNNAMQAYSTSWKIGPWKQAIYCLGCKKRTSRSVHLQIPHPHFHQIPSVETSNNKFITIDVHELRAMGSDDPTFTNWLVLLNKIGWKWLGSRHRVWTFERCKPCAALLRTTDSEKSWE